MTCAGRYAAMARSGSTKVRPRLSATTAFVICPRAAKDRDLTAATRCHAARLRADVREVIAPAASALRDRPMMPPP
jgi:hypothetical protein